MFRSSAALLALVIYAAIGIGRAQDKPTTRIFGWPLPSITASVVLGQTRTVTHTVQVPLYVVRTTTVYHGGTTATVYRQGSTVYLPASTVYQQLVSTQTQQLPCRGGGGGGGGGRYPPRNPQGGNWSGGTRTLTITRTLTNVFPGSPHSNNNAIIPPDYLRTTIPG